MMRRSLYPEQAAHPLTRLHRNDSLCIFIDMAVVGTATAARNS